jgi:hypothetical protein
VLFIRPIFVDLYEKREYLNKFSFPQGSTREDTLLRGVPGIGKSSFGLYVLWRLVKEGRSVWYEYPRGVDRGVPLVFGAAPYAAYIADGTWPTMSSYPTLLISSPRGGGSKVEQAIIYDDFLKRPYVSLLYMPPPRTEEMHTLRQACFPSVPEAEAIERMERWGNIPRQVLANITTEQAELEAAIELQNVAALTKLVTTMSEKVAVKDVTFRIVHYKLDGNLRRMIGYQWATSWIERRVHQRLEVEALADVLKLLEEMLKRPGFLQMSTTWFENWCDSVMRQGSGPAGFAIRRLGVGKLDAESMHEEDSEHLKELLQAADSRLGVISATAAADADRLIIPSVGETLHLEKPSELAPSLLNGHRRWRAKDGFAAADFIEANGVCSNATVSPSHKLTLQGELLHNGLRPILQKLQPDALGGAAPIPFLWLVPSAVFKEMRTGPMVIATVKQGAPANEAERLKVQAMKAACKAARELAPRVVQYALEIPSPMAFGKIQMH